MTTRFSLDLALNPSEQHRLVQLFEYLTYSEQGPAFLPAELTQYLGGSAQVEPSIEEHLADLIGSDPIGIDIVKHDERHVRIFDRDGAPNLRMLCQIIAHIVPSVLPLEFSFAVIDEDKKYYSGGLVVMTVTAAEIQVVDSKLKKPGKKSLH